MREVAHIVGAAVREFRKTKVDGHVVEIDWSAVLANPEANLPKPDAAHQHKADF